MARSAALVLDPCFEDHDTGPGHPERPERLERLRRTFRSSGLTERFRLQQPESATHEQLTRVHDPAYVQRVHAACAAGEPVLDSMDTVICKDSARIALLAAGSLVAICRDVAGRRVQRGLAIVRPPGHHAERDLAMGFCLFNNVAIAARDLQAACGIERVLIVDFDVHHGNGTQHIFEDDPSVFYFSLHQSPLYPGTGKRGETGRDAGRGATLNCPLPPGAGDVAFLGALRDELVPAAERFDPNFVLVSAGFDAHERDPLGGLEVTTEAYAEATGLLVDLAERTAGGRFVSVLEGGYDLDALSDAVVAHAEAILD